MNFLVVLFFKSHKVPFKKSNTHRSLILTVYCLIPYNLSRSDRQSLKLAWFSVKDILGTTSLVMEQERSPEAIIIDASICWEVPIHLPTGG